MERGDIPGLSAAKVQGGKLAWSVVQGRRQALNRAKDAPRVDAETVFEGASLGKPIVAMAVLSLVDQGKLSLEDRALTVLPLPGLRDTRASEITLRMLLSHSSGLSFGQPRLESKPGTQFRYSTFGFRYLQQIAEAKMGESLEKWASRALFQPLGMSRTSFVYGPGFAGNRAQGRNWLLRGQDNMTSSSGTGAFDLITTASDYARLWEGVLSGKVLGPESLQAMFSPQIAIIGRFDEPAKPKTVRAELAGGLGVLLQRQNGRWIGTQWGDNGGSTGLVLVDPSKKDAFVFLTNAEDGVHSAEALARLAGMRDGVAAWVGYRQAGTPLRNIWKKVTLATDQNPEGGVAAFRALLAKDGRRTQELARDLAYFHRFRGHLATADPFFAAAQDTPNADASMFEDWADVLVLTGRVREAVEVQRLGWRKFPTEPKSASLEKWIQAAEADLARAIPLDQKALPPLGEYEGFRVEVDASGELFLSSWNGRRALVSLGQGRFLSRDLAYRLEFASDRSPVSLTVTQAGRGAERVRLSR